MATCLISLGCYFWRGFNFYFLAGWLTGLMLTSVYFWSIRSKESAPPWLEKQDTWVLSGIALVSVAIFLPDVYMVPFQVNTDEIAILDQIIDMVKRQAKLDPLSPSSYFGFPVLIHLIFGWIALLMGGITFNNLRTIHAISGILCILLTYVFFRTLRLSTAMSAGASALVGSNHGMIAMSRMVSRNNTQLLLEMGAFSVLFRGLTRECPWLMFIGGAIAGLSFYTYTPARTIMFLFLLALALIAIFNRNLHSAAVLRKLTLCSLVGFALVIAPMLWATYKAPPKYFVYANNQFLIFPGGRAVQRAQVHADSEEEGVLINIKQGLLTFNWPIHDHGNIYQNPRHGFVDPVTGVLLWVGLFVLIWQRKSRTLLRQADVLIISSFLSLYLLYAFVITFAPNYLRLLAILPFVAYLCVHAIDWIGASLARAVSGLRGKQDSTTQRLFFATCIACIVFTNLIMYVEYVNLGFREGNIFGATYRAALSKSANEKHKFVLAADSSYPYYWWGDPGMWNEWIGAFPLWSRVVITTPSELINQMDQVKEVRESQLVRPPFTLFVNANLWQRIKSRFELDYPNYKISNMVGDGSKVSIEVER